MRASRLSAAIVFAGVLLAGCSREKPPVTTAPGQTLSGGAAASGLSFAPDIIERLRNVDITPVFVAAGEQ